MSAPCAARGTCARRRVCGNWCRSVHKPARPPPSVFAHRGGFMPVGSKTCTGTACALTLAVLWSWSVFAAPQIIVRHGDRTPAFNHMCWAGNTAVWTCNMTQLQLSSVTPWDTTVQPPRLFRKQFERGAEVLPTGNCGLGQLTTVGLQQQYNNGQVRSFRCLDRMARLL